MKYKIYNKTTGKYEDSMWIVDQDGLVAFWDESQGWCSSSHLVNQNDYEIFLKVNADPDTISIYNAEE